jgi:hypothetical protein
MGLNTTITAGVLHALFQVSKPIPTHGVVHLEAAAIVLDMNL